MQPLARVHAVERLVEEEDPRLVHERGGQLDPLAHPLGIGPDRPVCGVGQLDRADRPFRGRARVGDPLQVGVDPYELATRQVARDRLAFRHQSDHRVHGWIAERRPAADADRPRRRRQQTGEEVEERALARAVGAQQTGHAGAQRERHVVDRDDVAEPARDVLDLHGRHGRCGGHTVTVRYRRTIRASETTMYTMDVTT